MASGDRDRGFERFITFVDAIVAIAVTLLVLPLVDLTTELDEYASVADLLRANHGVVWAFLLSFAVTARLWFVQHESVANVLGYDYWVTRLLLLWSLTIVFLPFPTSLVAEAGSDPTTKILYIGSIVLSTMVLTVIEIRLVRHPELCDGEEDIDPVSGFANIALLLLALVITLAFPRTGYLPMLLLLLSGPVTNRWRRLRGRGVSPSPVGE